MTNEPGPGWIYQPVLSEFTQPLMGRTGQTRPGQNDKLTQKQGAISSNERRRGGGRAAEHS